MCVFYTVIFEIRFGQSSIFSSIPHAPKLDAILSLSLSFFRLSHFLSLSLFRYFYTHSDYDKRALRNSQCIGILLTKPRAIGLRARERKTLDITVENERQREREMEREAGRKENIFSHFGQAREREGEMVTQSSGSGGGSRVEQSPV